MRPVRYLTPEQWELVTRHLGLARSLARLSHDEPSRFHEEAHDAALDGLIGSARSFDPARGTKFSKYARIRIIYEVRQRLREAIDREAYERVGLHLTEALATLARADEERHKLDEIEAFEGLLENFPDAHRPVLRLVYLLGFTHDEAAAVLGISRPTLSRRLVEALRAYGTPDRIAFRRHPLPQADSAVPVTHRRAH